MFIIDKDKSVQWSVSISRIREVKKLSKTGAVLLEGPTPRLVITPNPDKLCQILDNAFAQSDCASDTE